MKKIIRHLFQRFGFTLSRTTPTGLVIDHHYQTFVEKAMEIVKHYSMLSRARLAILFEATQYISANKIPGAIIECGVWKGGAMGMLAQSCVHFDDIRQLHLFDSFDDICEPDAHIDGERAVREAGGIEHAHGHIKPLSGVYDKFGGHGTIETCQQLLSTTIGYPGDKIRYHKGWFQDTMIDKVPSIRTIAILRIDADWYASTKICLETFYDRVASNGMIIIDDYGAYDGCRKAVDDFARHNKLLFFRNHVDEECIYWFKT